VTIKEKSIVMSRAFSPPSQTLSNDDIRPLRDISINGLVGLGTGSLAGLAAHTAARIGNRRSWWALPLNKNTAFLTFMLGGAAGYAAGTNNVHFQIGDRNPSVNSSNEMSLDERGRNRLFRRATLKQSLEEGHGGLSDAHGGRWVKEEAPSGSNENADL
jgi:hypothetical protein